VESLGLAVKKHGFLDRLWSVLAPTLSQEARADTALAFQETLRDAERVSTLSRGGSDRRAFLKGFVGGLAGTAALATLDVDRLLWMPGAKTWFIPDKIWIANPALLDTLSLEPLTGRDHIRHGNPYLTLPMITREALRILENNLTFARRINREHDRLYVEGATIGDVIAVRKPPRYRLYKSEADYPMLFPVQEPFKPICHVESAPDMTLACKIVQEEQVGCEAELSDIERRAIEPDRQNAVTLSLVESMANKLAQDVERKGFNRIRDMSTTIGGFVAEAAVATNHVTGLSIRGIRHYDVATNSMRLRFDVRGAKT
jgi:hypothetical protein